MERPKEKPKTSEKKPVLDTSIQATQKETRKKLGEEPKYNPFRMRRTYVEGVDVVSVTDDERLIFPKNW